MEKINIFKEVVIGSLIKMRVEELKMENARICKFFKCSEGEINKMFYSNSLDSDSLLKWSKLLKYDFFRIYSQHLILYAPSILAEDNSVRIDNSSLPKFRKSLYTKQVIDFILDLIEKGDKTKAEIIDEYKIPKTTLYKWISKYSQ